MVCKACGHCWGSLLPPAPCLTHTERPYRPAKVVRVHREVGDGIMRLPVFGETHIPPNLVVGKCRRTLIASGSEDLQVEHPVSGGQAPAFHFDPTLACMQGPALVRDQVVQVRQPREKRLLIAVWMMKRFHHEQLPLDGVVGLIQQGAGHGHLRVGKDRIPARFLVLHPASHALAIGWPRGGGDVIDKMA